MPACFLDSSAVVKRYVEETGSSWVVDLAAPDSGNLLYVGRITGVEVVAALARRLRAGSLSSTEAATALSDFRFDLANQYRVVEMRAPLLSRAMSLAEVYALRGYDAVQLAAALTVNSHLSRMGMLPITLVSADVDLNAAAQAEGLAVEDPNAH